MIPESISAIDTQLTRVAGLTAPIDASFVEHLRETGFIVHTSHVFGSPRMPIHYGTVYEHRDTVQMPWYKVDAHLRTQLNAAGARLEQTKPRDVMFLFQGGQKGRGKGGIFVYKNHGPLIISASTDNATQNINAVVDAYKDELKIAVGEKSLSGSVAYDEATFERAANNALGVRITERSRIPMGIISLPNSDDAWTPVAWYFPDSQTIVSMNGQLLPYKTGDSKTRAALPWKNFQFQVHVSRVLDKPI